MEPLVVVNDRSHAAQSYNNFFYSPFCQSYSSLGDILISGENFHLMFIDFQKVNVF